MNHLLTVNIVFIFNRFFFRNFQYFFKISFPISVQKPFWQHFPSKIRFTFTQNHRSLPSRKPDRFPSKKESRPALLCRFTLFPKALYSP